MREHKKMEDIYQEQLFAVTMVTTIVIGSR